MSMPIPRPTVAATDLQDHIEAVGQTLDRLTGQVPGAAGLDPLPETATLADVIKAVNILIDRVS